MDLVNLPLCVVFGSMGFVFGTMNFVFVERRNRK
jgi:hypothetical protein